MALIRARKKDARGSGARKTDESGIALFMVMAAISVLAVLVTEFSYVAQVNQRLAFDGLDQLKAHYLAKSGLKLSLLRLKAYQTVKGLTGDKSKTGGAVPQLPQSILDKIWSFPFIFPIPTTVPGLTPGDREQIEKFQNASGLQGNFSALVESESSRLNVNMILSQFWPKAAASPTPRPTAGPRGAPSPGPSPSIAPYNADEARKSLSEYLQTLLTNKAEADPDFGEEYRDLKMEDLMDTIVAWADPTYERRQSGMQDAIPMKRAPFYTLTEMHMLPGIDDTLYDLFAPALTVSQTSGININTMQEAVLRALVPQMTVDEVKEFFKFRDSMDEDNTFKDADAFYKYLTNSVAAFQGNQGAVTSLKDSLEKRGIRLMTDETQFKITVQAQVNQATRTIQAWVTLGDSSSTNKPSDNSPSTQPAPTPTTSGASATGEEKETPDAGIRITFMRIL